MSTTPQYADSTSTTDDHTQTRDRSRPHASAPQLFSTTNRKPLPPAFGDESWASGEP